MRAGERKTEKDATLNARFLYQRNSFAKAKILTENCKAPSLFFQKNLPIGK